MPAGSLCAAALLDRRGKKVSGMAGICHRTGQYVPPNLGGTWSDERGHSVDVEGSDVFPPCRVCGSTTCCRERE
jgi:hypothetical protein